MLYMRLVRFGVPLHEGLYKKSAKYARKFTAKVNRQTRVLEYDHLETST